MRRLLEIRDISDEKMTKVKEFLNNEGLTYIELDNKEDFYLQEIEYSTIINGILDSLDVNERRREEILKRLNIDDIDQYICDSVNNINSYLECNWLNDKHISLDELFTKKAGILTKDNPEFRITDMYIDGNLLVIEHYSEWKYVLDITDGNHYSIYRNGEYYDGDLVIDGKEIIDFVNENKDELF